jgi:glycine/D-amino acid oxidase-like deaminating enzyme
VSWYVGPEGEGLFFPNDGACHPVRRVHALAALAEREGAVLYEQSRVREVHDGRVELLNGATVHAPIVMVCADGALGELVPDTAPLLRQVRLQMLATEPAPEVQLPRPVYARYGYDYWQQLPDHRIVFGGGRDQFINDEYTASDAPSEAVQGWLEQRLRQCVETSAAITHRWAATVSYTHDELPVARVFDGVWGVGGYCGTGNVVGALCARGAVRRALGASDAFLDTIDAIRAEGTSR